MNDGCKSRWPEPEPQSALVIVVPDAEFLVEVVRSAHDPAAAAGIPPHITVLYPFLPPKQLSAAGIRQEVASCFQQFVPFDFVLVSVKRFPGTKERRAAETRVAATPETVKKLIGLGLTVAIETGAGLNAAIPDPDFAAAGAEIAPKTSAALSGANIVFALQMPEPEQRALIPRGALLVSGPMAASASRRDG